MHRVGQLGTPTAPSSPPATGRGTLPKLRQVLPACRIVLLLLFLLPINSLLAVSVLGLVVLAPAAGAAASASEFIVSTFVSCMLVFFLLRPIHWLLSIVVVLLVAGIPEFGAYSIYSLAYRPWLARDALSVDELSIASLFGCASFAIISLNCGVFCTASFLAARRSFRRAVIVGLVTGMCIVSMALPVAECGTFYDVVTYPVFYSSCATIYLIPMAFAFFGLYRIIVAEGADRGRGRRSACTSTATPLQQP